MSTVDQKLSRLKELKEKHDEIGKEIETLHAELQSDLSAIMGSIGAAPKKVGVGKGKGTRACSICGTVGHNSRSCPDAPAKQGVENAPDATAEEKKPKKKKAA